VSYFHTLSLFGRTSNVVVDIPYVWGSTTGTIAGEVRRREVEEEFATC
jgi:hypothetical protein